MKYLLLPIVLFSFLVVGCKSKDDHLIWSDEFDYDGLPDSEKWNYEEGQIRNNEEQYYTVKREKNVRTENGHLLIEAHREDYEGAHITSASLNTKNKQHFLYGRIEARLKVPLGRGTWPAFWMLGVNIPEVGWPMCGELDIMENVGFDSLRIHGNIHTKAYNHVLKTGKGNSILVEKPWEEFHVYAMEWRKDKIDFFVDDLKYFTYENDGKGNPETWPFDKEHYIIINLAIGGDWGGQHGVDYSKLPLKYEIDYVRVYKLNP